MKSAFSLQNREAALAWRVLPDICAFGIGLGIAYFMNWETRDLVWSLWLCSLSLGYLTLFSAIGGAAYIGFHAVRHPDFDTKHFWPALLIATASGLFFLAFFSIHFGAFHSVHAVFLGAFFPLEGVPTDEFGKGFMNPPKLIWLVYTYLAKPYGIFVLPALIAERKHVFSALIKAVSVVRENKVGPSDVKSHLRKNKKAKSANKNGLQDVMGRPYINVIRMHLLIFFFGFCHLLKIDSFVVFAVVYFVYFFPWNEVKRHLKIEQSQAATSLKSETEE